jgi:hypothetical protein
MDAGDGIVVLLRCTRKMEYGRREEKAIAGTKGCSTYWDNLDRIVEPVEHVLGLFEKPRWSVRQRGFA